MYRRGPVIQCLIGGAFAVLIILQARIVLASTLPSTDADILFQQLETNGTAINIDADSGGRGTFAQFVGQRSGAMVPFVRMKLKMVDTRATTGTVFNFGNGGTIPVTLEIYN